MRGPEVIEMGGNCPCSPKARVSLWRRKGTVAEQGKNMLAALCLRWNQKKTFPWTLVLWGDDIYVVTADVGVQPWLNSDGNFNQVGRRWKSPKQQVPKSVVIRDVCVRGEPSVCVFPEQPWSKNLSSRKRRDKVSPSSVAFMPMNHQRLYAGETSWSWEVDLGVAAEDLLWMRCSSGCSGAYKVGQP